MANEKKVIVFIVEGSSEEAAIGTIMKNYFPDEQIQFVVVHGDIIAEENVNSENIVMKINEYINQLKERYRYKTSDFLKIIHLADTDGVFIDDNAVHLADAPSIEYSTDHIKTQFVERTLSRNHKKADLLLKLQKTGKINSIPYRIYFNSCNLEHVLYNELKGFSNAQKEEMSDDFAERYEGHLDEFINFINDQEFSVPGTYQETWNFIKKESNSLNRYSNMHQIFEK